MPVTNPYQGALKHSRFSHLSNEQPATHFRPSHPSSTEPPLQWALEQAGIACPPCIVPLGTELLHHTSASGPAIPPLFAADAAERLASGQTGASSDLFLITQGRVRLLCSPPSQARPVSALLLEVGDTFGAEDGLGVEVLEYRAIAATEVEFVRVSNDQLTQFLERFPDWRQELVEQAGMCDRLLFLRYCPEGQHRHPAAASTGELPASRLLQPIALDWSLQTVAAGTLLAEATPPQSGRFWLRQGVICGVAETVPGASSPPAAVPGLGESWGYPHPVPPDWTAETNLLVYRLVPEHWENLSLLSVAATPPSPESLTPAVPILPAPLPASPPVTPPPSPPVDFPKPVRRHLLDLFDRYPWVEQQSSSDCGAACLAMVSRYWGKRIPIYILREQANVGRSGASLKSLAKAAEGIGFHARPVRASLSRLLNQKGPWIAHWEGNHYVVVYRASERRVVIADPAQGRRTLSRKAFQTHWTGYALLLEPTEQLQSIDVQQKSLGRYLGALVPYRGVITQILVVSLLIQLFSLVTPLFTQIILDRVVAERSQTTLNVFAVGLLLFGVWGICLGSVRQYLLSYFSNRLDLTLLSGFIRYALALPLKFFESRRVGDILTRVQENHKIQQFLIGQVVLSWLEFLTGFVYLGLMLYYNWRLTLLVLLLIPPIVGLTLGATPFLRQISRQIFNEVAEQNSSLVEMMTGIATVKSAAAEQDLRWRWEDRLTSQINMVFRGQKLGIGLQWTSGVIHSIGGTALLWYGATLVIQNQLTIGQFVAFNMMMGYVISPVVALANLWDEMQEVLISVERLNDVFETAPEEASSSLLVLPPLQGRVQFENVTFRYGEDEDHNTLQNLSLDVQPGETIALVGRSGSGKTTLIKLVEGLYFPNRGRVCVDGHDLRHVSLHSLRSQMGVVPQECFLFSGTILENITLYRPEYSLEQVIEVSKLAEAHAFIQSLPLGYSTKVGERGSSLSGGQRQRIAIARALLGNPRILLLDEATSSLDTESERRFQQNLAQISRDRTTFIIAHRLSTVRNADRILVLDRGVLVEQGNHETLMSQQGLYCHLAQQQLDL